MVQTIGARLFTSLERGSLAMDRYLTISVDDGSADGVLKAIYESISDLNVQLPQEQRVEKSPQAVLFGAGGKLDSLSLANFIVIAEQKLYDSLGLQINLTEDDPFSPNTGHFRTIESLANYVSDLVSRKTKVPQ
jgi:acyl carrier protein